MLTSCTAGAPTGDGGIVCAPEGSASKSVQVDGDFGSNSLKVSGGTPVEAKSLERSVLTKGDGDAVKNGQAVDAQLSVFKGSDGSQLSSEDASLVIDPQKMQQWVIDTVGCATVGDRIVATAPASDIVGAGNVGNVFQGVNDSDTLVLVFDVKSAADAPKEVGTLDPSELLPKADGTPVEAAADLPTVVLAEDGSPTITMPEGVAPPTKLTVATLIEGNGEEVKEGDRVYVNYRGVIWRTGEEFDSSWKRGAPADFLTTQVIGGFQKALVGQKVGSQVMSIVPADDGGYGSQWLTQNGYEADDVMVFVLDILGTVHAD